MFRVTNLTMISLVFCPGGEGVCLVSCGTTEVEQKQEFDYLRFGETAYRCQRTTKVLKTSRFD